MKFRFFFLFAFLINILLAYSQKKFQIENADSFQLKAINEISASINMIPFKEIIVRDLRFDTTKIGYIKIDYPGDKKIHKITVEENSSSYFTRILNYRFKNNLTPSSENCLVIIIKKLWMQRKDIVDSSSRKFVLKNGYTSSDNGKYHADLQAFALSNDNYQALEKLEGIYYPPLYWSSKIKTFIFQPFDSLLRKIEMINTESVLSKKRLISEAELSDVYLKRFNIPILTQGINEKGVFMTFSDFKNNNKTHPDFYVRSSKLSDQLYIKTDKTEELLTDFWGFYDGKEYYIRVGFNFFKLYRQNNTFDIYGAKYMSNTISQNIQPGNRNVPGYKIVNQTTKLEHMPFQLNMETGELY